MIKVLLVDDSEDDYLLTEEYLRDIFRSNYHITWMKNWDEGLDAAVQGTYDICLVDHLLGAKRGLALIEEAVRLNPEVVAVMLTGRADRELDTAAMAAGAIDFLPKSDLSPASLERTIRHAIDRAREQRNLRRALLRAEKAELGMKKFLANVTHELRSPLVGLLGYAEQLRNADPKAVANIRHAVEAIANTSLHLINDLLEYSKCEQRKLTLSKRWFPLNRVVEGALAIVQPRADQLEVSVHRTGPIPEAKVYGDPERIQQVLVNLLSNAVKFSPAGTVRIEAAVEESIEKDVAILRISDNGIGIPEEKLEAIFEPFLQADELIYSRFGGTGLGLAISKDLIDLHGGTIQVESTLGQGSVFEVCFPRQPKDPTERPTIDPTALGKLRVLIVDDLSVNRMMLTKQLSKLGIHADTAKNGYEVLKMAKKNHYDLILMDVNMPGLSGIQTTLELIKVLDLKELPWILGQTAHTDRDIHKECLAVGMADVLTKPLKTDHFLSALEKLIGSRT